MKFWRMMGRYDSETTAYTAVAGAGAVSPFRPDFNGRLVGLRTIAGYGAATSLINHIQWKLTCTRWVPNSIEVGGQGCGLYTAPALQPAPIDWPVEQEIQSGVDVTIEARNVSADTLVTVDAQLYGCFEVGGR